MISSIPTAAKPEQEAAKDSSLFTQVNIDSFKERTFEDGYDVGIYLYCRTDVQN